MIALEARKLTKRFPKKTAVDQLDLQVQEGEMLALLGINGAGKTTTIRMLTCLSRPTEGEAFVCGHSVLTQAKEVKAEIGISPQDTAISPNLTIRENLQMMAEIDGQRGDTALQAVDEIIRALHLEKEENTRAKTLSGGWQRRLSIGMAMIGKPKVLFLDEPTLGLDVLARRELWAFIRQLKGQMTIVLTTHAMDEAEALADRIAIMADGHLLATGTLAELEARSGKQGLEDVFIAIVEGRADHAA